MSEDHDSRTLISPRTGTKVSLLVAIPLLLAAAYFFWVPITLQSPETGSTFNCGTAASPPTSGFQKGTCGDLNKINKFRAIGLGASALLIGGLGAAMFGAERREETRPRRTREEDERRADGRRRDDEPRDHRDDLPRDATNSDEEPRRGARRAFVSDEPRGARRAIDPEPETDEPRRHGLDSEAAGRRRSYADDDAPRGRQVATDPEPGRGAPDTDVDDARGSRRLAGEDRGWFEDETEIGRRYDAETRSGRHSQAGEQLRSRRRSED